METTGKIILSKGLAKKLAVEREGYIKVRVGGVVINTKMLVGSRQRESFILSPALQNALHIRRKHRLRVQYEA